MPRHGENIYKRKDGRYEGRYVIGRTEKGKTRFGYVYGRRYMDVKKRLLNKKNEISFQQTSIRKNCDYTWLAEYWLKHEAVTRISLSSFSCYRRMIQNQLIPFFGGIRLINLKAHHIQRFLCQLTARGLAHSTKLSLLRLLKATLQYAVDEGLMPVNPCARIRITQRKVSPQRVLSRQEHVCLLQAAHAAGDLSVLLGLSLGLRIGEVCGLQWQDIDWKQQTISVCRTVQRVQKNSSNAKTTIIIGQPKSASSARTLPLPAALAKLLVECRSRQQVPSTYILGQGEHVCEPRVVQRKFSALVALIQQPIHLGITSKHHTIILYPSYLLCHWMV